MLRLLSNKFTALMTHLLSPPAFLSLARQAIPWLSIGCVVSLIYGLIGGLALVPADYLQGEGFRILYVHVPCAFLSLAIYTVMAVAAVMGLTWGLKLPFLAMHQCAYLGAMFTALALVTGSLWGKPMWGTYWIWDARLTSELILLFLYVGILALHSALTNARRRDRATAVLVVIGFMDIPIIHYSVNWWNTLHQGATVQFFGPSHIAAEMVYPLLAMTIALSCYFVLALILRLRNELWLLGYAHDPR
jgi:heme exporter protein C